MKEHIGALAFFLIFTPVILSIGEGMVDYFCIRKLHFLLTFLTLLDITHVPYGLTFCFVHNNTVHKLFTRDRYLSVNLIQIGCH